MPALFKNLLNAISPLILKALGLGGFWGWAGNLIMQYGGQALYDLASDLWRKINRSVEQNAAKEKKDEVVSKPDASADEVGKAYEDYYNSGRH